MKNYFLLAMLSALAVSSSCSLNERYDDTSKSGNSLGFSTYIGTSTKAVELINTAFTEFNIEAYSYADNITTSAANTDVAVTTHIPLLKVSRTYDAGESTFSDWSYVGDYYWPASNYLNFFAYSPISTSIVSYNPPTYESARPTLVYTASDVIKNQIDLIAASAVDKTGDVADSKVNLAFKHILTQINFSVTGETAKSTENETDYYYEVFSIKLTTVPNVGTYTYAGEDTVSNTTTGSTTSQAASSGIGTWAVTTATVDYNYFVAVDSDSNVVTPTTTIGEGDEAVTTTNAMFSSETLIATNNTTQSTFPATAGVEALMLIPQADLSNVEIVIEYRVWKGTDLVEDFTGTSAKKYSLGVLEWVAGNNLRYNITLPIDATPIVFTTDPLESWVTAEVKDIPVEDED